MSVRAHMLLAFTLAVVLVGWGILLSPPFKDFRVAVGLPEKLPGSRLNNGAAEIINPDVEKARDYLGRITHYYHVLFVILYYGTIAALSIVCRVRGYEEALYLALIGTLMSVVGGITFSYIDHSFYWHGLFIAGLALSFSSGLLIVLGFRPEDPIDWALITTGLLMVVGVLIGGYVGSSYMDAEVSDLFTRAKIDSRFNPDFGEENALWRALSGHQHAMVALSLVLIFLVSLKVLGVRRSKLSTATIYGVIVGETVMALSSYSVWFFGKVAHTLITPAALLLILSTLIASFRTRDYPLLSPKGVLSWGLRLGNLWMWLFVAVPGAIVAISLRRSTIFFDPNFRHEVWDWSELAYNIGHWHILIATWGVMLVLVYLSLTAFQDPGSRLLAISGWVTLLGLLASTSSINLYMLCNPPGRYSPNPYDNVWLKILVEPSLALMSIGVAASYILLLLKTSSAKR